MPQQAGATKELTNALIVAVQGFTLDEWLYHNKHLSCRQMEDQFRNEFGLNIGPSYGTFARWQRERK